MPDLGSSAILVLSDLTAAFDNFFFKSLEGLCGCHDVKRTGPSGVEDKPPYLLPLEEICQRHSMSFHIYADDSQIYMPISKNSHCPPTPLFDYLRDANAWFAQNFLKLKE